ncbi:hypothetical protein Lfu02_34780 [Longispora fulva]|nr:hypothetical protein Lfu02_34780 [Longispora fulva]
MLALASLTSALALAACGSPSTDQATEPTTTHSAPTTGAVQPSRSAAPSATRSAAPSATRAAGAAATPGAAACPVRAEDLVSALKTGSGDLYTRAGRPAAVEAVVCVGDFSVARTVSDGTTQPSRVLFHHVDGTWRPISLGSAHYCTAEVPADIAAQLPGCA